MSIVANKPLFAAIASIALVACFAQPESEADSSSEQDVNASRPYLSPNKCKVAGAYVAPGATATPEQVALDAYCGDLFAKTHAANGWVVMFGSSRLKDGTPEYDNARQFASQWTTAHTPYPIMTGGGPGIMEAGNRGAQEANGPSLGFSTFFKAPTDSLNTFVSDGHMFADFETRERAMLRYAKAAVIYWGGVGTGWELFMTLSDVQTGRLAKIPIVVVGSDLKAALKPYFDWMVAKGTVAQADLDQIVYVDTPADTVTALKTGLALP
jgi:predicted Rossmann-fold nucleotide-binding protein